MNTFMGIGGIIGIIVAVLVVIILLVWFVNTYNKLVKSRNRVRNSFSQIDVQLKRRFDLIPNLVATVKGYAEHEKSIWENFAKARQLYIDAAKENNIGKMADANNMITNTCFRLTVGAYAGNTARIIQQESLLIHGRCNGSRPMNSFF